MGKSFPKLISKFNLILDCCCPNPLQKKYIRKTFPIWNFLMRFSIVARWQFQEFQTSKRCHQDIKSRSSCCQIHGFAMLQYSCPYWLVCMTAAPTQHADWVSSLARSRKPRNLAAQWQRWHTFLSSTNCMKQVCDRRRLSVSLSKYLCIDRYRHGDAWCTKHLSTSFSKQCARINCWRTLCSNES